MAKNKRYDEVYEKMGTRKGEKEVYRIAKSRAKSQRDFGYVKYMRGEDGEVLVMDNEIQDRWRRYFVGLMNEGAELVELGEEGRE